MKSSGKWVYEYGEDNEVWGCGDEFGTKEEAVSSARLNAREWANDNLCDEDEVDEYLNSGCFEIAQLKTPTYRIDGEMVIEHITEQVYEECGEASEDWLVAPRWTYNDKDNAERKAWREKEEDLSEMLTATFNDWLDKYDLRPKFYCLDNMKTYRVSE